MTTLKSSSENIHFPVMLDEVVKICSPDKGGIFVDCTFGGGGYSKKLLEFPKTKVIALDRDEYVLYLSEEIKKKYATRFHFHNKKFSQINKVVGDQLVDAVLFDLGLSSIQLNDFERGFSFGSKGSLNMEMGLTKITVKDVINNFSEEKLKLIIKIFGEEKEAAKIAKNIVKARSICKITKTDQLTNIIAKSKTKSYKQKINPSTKTFQALRIFVNNEISELIIGIINATKILKPGGKILVVSFHSIEDKIVKFFFSNFSSSKPKSSRYIPDLKIDENILFKQYKNKILLPSQKEINKNRASRSAKLRFAIRNNSEFVYPNNFIKKFKRYLDLEKAYV